MKIKLLLTSLVVILFAGFGLSQGQATGYYLGTGTGADVANQGISCASCHSANGIASPKWDTWKNTLHAVATDTGFSQSSHFGYSCLRCHASGWNDTAVTFGADEYVVQDDSLSPNYRPTDLANWNRTKNVGCEACHGNLGKYDPTAADTLTTDYTKHFAFSTTNKLDYSAELCGLCHNGSHHGFYEEWAVSGHAKSLLAAGGMVTKNATCVKCHVAQNASAYVSGTFFTGVDKGKPYYDKILVDSNSPDIQPITCVACHDPHTAVNGVQQLRLPITGQVVVCDKCHNSEIETDTVDVNTTPHHNTSEALSGSKKFGYRYPASELAAAGRDTVYQSSAHTFAATERCIDCHLNADDKDQFGNAAHGHTFLPKVQACAKCHADYYTAVDTSNHAEEFDYRRTQTVTDSLITVLTNKLALSTSADSSTMAFKEANYNLAACTQEGSHGIHNTKLVQKLLGDAIALYTPSGTTDIKLESSALPSSYTLSQNYPNPFNPSTEIKFSLPEASNVKLTIYDAIGKEVAVLVNDYLSTGSYRYTWNAANLASGIYFYRIEAKNFNMVKKMVLLK